MGAVKKFQLKAGHHLLRAKDVILIGVAPNEEDTHIWGPLAETEAMLHFSDFDGRVNKWCEQNRTSRPYRFIGKDFLASAGSIIRLLSEKS